MSEADESQNGGHEAVPSEEAPKVVPSSENSENLSSVSEEYKVKRNAVWFIAFLLVFPFVWLLAYIAVQSGLSQLCSAMGLDIFRPEIVDLRTDMLFVLPIFLFVAVSFKWPRFIVLAPLAIFFWWCFWPFLCLPSPGCASRMCRNACLRPISAAGDLSLLRYSVDNVSYPSTCGETLNKEASTILKDLEEKNEYQSINPRFVCRLLVLDSPTRARCYRVEKNDKDQAVLYSSSWEHTNAATGSVRDRFVVSSQIRKKERELSGLEYERLLQFLKKLKQPRALASEPLGNAKSLFEYQLGTSYHFMNIPDLDFLESVEKQFVALEKIDEGIGRTEQKSRAVPMHPLYKESLLRIEAEAKETQRRNAELAVIGKPIDWPIVLRDEQTKGVVTTSWVDGRMVVNMELSSKPDVLKTLKESGEIYSLFFEPNADGRGTHVPVRFAGQPIEGIGGASRLRMTCIQTPLFESDYRLIKKVQIIYGNRAGK